MTSPAVTPMVERRRWRVLDAVLAFGGGVVATALAYFLVDAPDLDAGVVFGVLVPAQAVGMLGVVALLAPRREPWRTAFRWSLAPVDSVGVLIGAGLQVVLSIAGAVIAEYVLRREPPVQDVVDVAAGAATPVEWALVVLSVVIVGPLAEEVVFRGVVLRALEPRGRTVAVYGSALLFALVHLFDPNALLSVPFFFVLGVVLGHAVIRTGRIGRAFTIHAGFNLLTVVALYSLSVS